MNHHQHAITQLSYPILIGASLLEEVNWLPKTKISQMVIITDHQIKKCYGLRLQKYLRSIGYQVLLFSFPAGEASKNIRTKQTIENAMCQHHCDRDTLILALGGGVVGDLAGFIAATFLRGVAYIQLPTSLLAMVDSSIGGKTGINTRHGKNLIGSIYPPAAVIIDQSLLKTLSKTHFINGLIECIKIFLTHDANYFDYVESKVDLIMQGNELCLTELITAAVRLKVQIVRLDEKDNAERNTLNFGHTIGHALEKLSNYRLLHGFAVGYGILVEATISYLLGLLEGQHLIKIKKMMAILNIYGKDLKKYSLVKLIAATKKDKKRRLNKVQYVLLNKIGCVHMTDQQFVHEVDDHMVKQALKKIIEA